MLTNNCGLEPAYLDLKLAFLVEPRIDLRRLQRAFAKLSNRHDALRQSFARRGDDWFVNVWNRHKSGVVVEDHGDLNDSDFDALLRHHASLRVDLLDDVLFQTVVLKCGQRGDVLFIRCHHAIIDGHSMIVLSEDWLKLLIGLPLTGQGLTHEEYLLEHSTLSPQQMLDNQNYWNQLLFPALPNPGLGQFGSSSERSRIIYRTDTIRSLTFSLNDSEFKKIQAAANACSQTVFSVIFAAFADALIELSGLPGIYAFTNVDRTSNKLRNFVGYATVLPPVRCEAANGAALDEYASLLASQLRQSLVHLPSTAAAIESDFDLAVHKSGGVLRHFSCSAAFADARMKKSPFSPGFLASPETPQKFGPLTIKRLGIKTADYCFSGLKLGITTYVDQILFDFIYHDHLYSNEDIRALARTIQEKLRVNFGKPRNRNDN